MSAHLCKCNHRNYLQYSLFFLVQIPFMIDSSQSPLVPAGLAGLLALFKCSEWTVPLHTLFFYAALGAWTMIENIHSRMLFVSVLFEQIMELGLRPEKHYQEHISIPPLFLLAMQTTIGLQFLPTIFQQVYLGLNAIDIFYNYIYGTWPEYKEPCYHVLRLKWPIVNGRPSSFVKMVVVRASQLVHLGLLCVGMTQTTNTYNQLFGLFFLLFVAWILYKFSIALSNHEN
jgi:hypothetical protein